MLTGHVVGSVIQTMVSLARRASASRCSSASGPTAGPVEWLAAAGVLALLTFALTWLSVALGLVTKTVETASNLPMPLMLLPFLGSGFVPTDSMPTGLRWFAEYQPFTPDHRDPARPADGHPDRQQRASSPSPGAPASRWPATSGRRGCSTAIRSPDPRTEPAVATGTASEPTPPAAALTTTVSPRRTARMIRAVSHAPRRPPRPWPWPAELYAEDLADAAERPLNSYRVPLVAVNAHA